MGLNLQKGQRLDLSKADKTLVRGMVGLGWATNMYSGSDDFDLDASVFMLGANGRVPSDQYFVFYGNPQQTGVKHMGDNRVGSDGASDDEQIQIDFSQVPAEIMKLVVTVTIYNADERRQSFGMVSSSYVRICNADTGVEVARFDPSNAASVNTALVFCEFIRQPQGWVMNPVGEGFVGGLVAMCAKYGIEAENG